MKRNDIKKLVKKYQDKFGLQNWDIIIKYKLLKKKKDSDYSCCTVRFESDIEYFMVTLTFNTAMLDKIDKDDIIHEMYHLVILEYKNFCTTDMSVDNANQALMLEERMVSVLERIYLRNAGKE